MPSVAAWLLARPHNAVFALAITMLLPGLAMLSGAILVFLVLQQDLRKAFVAAAFASLILVVISIVVGASQAVLLLEIALSWLPVIVLATVLRASRSLTLTLQLSVIMVLLGVGAFFVLMNDPVAFWQEMISLSPILQAGSLQEWKAALSISEEQFAGVMTTMFAIGVWFGFVIVVTLGYRLYQVQPGKTGAFGRFCDLNFGRVIASLLAITSVAGFAFDVIWIESIAFVVFAVFWLQGIAMVHWLHASAYVPVFVVIAAYVLTIVLGQFALPALAVLGYTDAWFHYRRRVTKQQ